MASKGAYAIRPNHFALSSLLEGLRAAVGQPRNRLSDSPSALGQLTRFEPSMILSRTAGRRLWVIRVESDISARGPVTPQFRTWIAWRRSPRRTSYDPALKRSPDITARAVGGNRLRFRRLGFLLKFSR